MRQHTVQRTAIEYKLPARRPSLWQHVPRWTYPLAAAAAVGLIYIGWWTFKPVRPVAWGTAPTTPSTVADELEHKLRDADDVKTVDELEQNFRNSNRMQSDEMRNLRQVERQVADLSDGNPNLLDGLLSQHIGLSDNE